MLSSEEITSFVIKEDHEEEGIRGFPYENAAFPYPNDVPGLPTGITSAAAEGNFILISLRGKNLQEKNQIREWTVHPGRRYFDKFKIKFKVICENDGPYKQFNNGLINQASLPASIVTTIINSGFSQDTLWVPLCAYIAVLLVKTGLNTYCEE